MFPSLPPCNNIEMIMLMSCLLITGFTISLLKYSSSYKVMYGKVTSSELKCEVISARVYKTQDPLAATITASAFTLIGPAACYTGVHAHAESVCQNCVLERCANLCTIIVLHF